MKLSQYLMIGALVLTTTPKAFAKPGGEAFSTSLLSISIIDPGLGATATLGLLLTACSDMASDEGAEGFGACLVSPIGGASGSTKGSTEGLSSKKERQERVAVLKTELVKVMAGETEVHPAAASLVNARIIESQGKISAPEAAAQMFRYLQVNHTEI
jgi:hypothetical protein